MINPNDLIQLGFDLLTLNPRRPSQINLRRAISNAYYALFHTLAIVIADEIVGSSCRALPIYELVYRRIDHGSLKKRCEALKATVPVASAYGKYLKSFGGSFHPDITTLAGIIGDFQAKRHAADYDPHARFRRGSVDSDLKTAREAIRLFQSAPADQKKTFLLLLAFEPRQ